MHMEHSGAILTVKTEVLGEKPVKGLLPTGEQCRELWCETFRKLSEAHTGWRTKCHNIDCARNTFLLLQKYLTSGTELILIGWRIVPNEEHVHCDHRFASQPLANEPLHSSQLFDTSLQKARGTTSLCGP